MHRYGIQNFPTLDFLIRKIKEREIQKSFCHSLPYFSIYPDENFKEVEKAPSQNVYSGDIKSMKGFRSYKNKPKNYQKDDLEQQQTYGAEKNPGWEAKSKSYGAEKNPGWEAKPKKQYGTSPGYKYHF